VVVVTFLLLEENFVYLLALKSGEGAKLVDRDEGMVLLAGRSFDLHEQPAAKALGSSEDHLKVFGIDYNPLIVHHFLWFRGGPKIVNCCD
jgi:hypothetical protein